LLASPDGSKLYVGVGSNSNITENGIQAEYERAAIWEMRASGAHRIFASGLRNPTGLAWEPETRKLWAIVNERDSRVAVGVVGLWDIPVRHNPTLPGQLRLDRCFQETP
jgi:glucose/arabinose dehydrogenase